MVPISHVREDKQTDRMVTDSKIFNTTAHWWSQKKKKRHFSPPPQKQSCGEFSSRYQLGVLNTLSSLTIYPAIGLEFTD